MAQDHEIVGRAAKSWVLGVVFTLLLAALLYANFMLWQDYLYVGGWAFLLSQAMYALRQGMVDIIRDLRQDDVKEPKPLWTRIRTLVRANAHPKILVEHFLDYSFPIFGFVLLISIFFHSLSGMMTLTGLLFMIAATVGILIYVLDTKLLSWWHWLGLSDENFVTIVLIFGGFVITAFVAVFLGAQTVLEGMEAINVSMEWVQQRLHDTVNDEGTQQQWAAAIEQAKEQAETAYKSLEESQNMTEWWPTVRAVHDSVLEGKNNTEITIIAHKELEVVYSNESWWSGVESLVNWSLDEESTEGLATSVMDVITPYLDFNHLKDIALEALGAVGNPLSAVMTVLSQIGGFLGAIAESGSATIMFLLFLFKMLNSRTDFLTLAVQLLVPANQRTRSTLVQAFRVTLEGVFFVPIQLACSHALVTVITFSLFQIKFVYFATFLVLIVSLLQGDASIMIVPWSLALILPNIIAGDYFTLSPIIGIVVFAIHYVAFNAIDDAILEINSAAGRVSSPLLTAIALGLGVATFGTAGILLGPLLTSLLFVLVGLQLGDSWQQEGGDTASTAPQGEKAQAEESARVFANVSYNTGPKCRVPLTGTLADFIASATVITAANTEKDLVLHAVESEALITDISHIIPGEHLVLLSKDFRSSM